MCLLTGRFKAHRCVNLPNNAREYKKICCPANREGDENQIFSTPVVCNPAGSVGTVRIWPDCNPNNRKEKGSQPPDDRICAQLLSDLNAVSWRNHEELVQMARFQYHPRPHSKHRIMQQKRNSLAAPSNTSCCRVFAKVNNATDINAGCA